MLEGGALIARQVSWTSVLLLAIDWSGAQPTQLDVFGNEKVQEAPRLVLGFLWFKWSLGRLTRVFAQSQLAMIG